MKKKELTPEERVNQSRETRLWIQNVIFPLALIGWIASKNPNVQKFAKDSANNAKEKATKVKDFFSKKKSPDDVIINIYKDEEA